MQTSSFFKKILNHIRLFPVTFIFLLVMLAGTFLFFSIVKKIVYREGYERFNTLSQDLETIVTNRINRTIDLPILLAKGLRLDATKGELDDYISSLSLETRYPSVREVGIYATSLDGKDLRRLYSHEINGNKAIESVPQESSSGITETDLKNAVLAQKGNQSNQPVLIKLYEGKADYLTVVPQGNESYLFVMFNASVALNHLYPANSVFQRLDFTMYDSIDQANPLFQSRSNSFESHRKSYTALRQVNVGTSPWLLITQSNQKYIVRKLTSAAPTFTLIFGSSISLIIFSLLLNLSRRRRNELHLSAEISRNVKIIEEKYQKIIKEIEAEIGESKDKNNALREQIKELERLHKIMVGRELRMIELKGHIAKINGPKSNGKR